MGIFSQIKGKLQRSESIEDEFVENPQEGYVELGTDQANEHGDKTLVRPFTLEDFEDIKTILDALREGNIVALINIKPLKEKEITELKRAVAKLRKTCDALGGEIAGFTEDLVIATSNDAKIYKAKSVKQIEE